MNLFWEYLKSAINAFGIICPDDKISVMIYPTEYLNLNNIYTDRYYNLWMLESNYGYEYIDYLKRGPNPGCHHCLINNDRRRNHHFRYC